MSGPTRDATSRCVNAALCNVVHAFAALGPIFLNLSPLVSHDQLPSLFLRTVHLWVYISAHILQAGGRWPRSNTGRHRIFNDLESHTKSKVAVPPTVDLLSSRHRRCSMRLQCFQGCLPVARKWNRLHRIANLRGTPHQVPMELCGHTNVQLAIDSVSQLHGAFEGLG
jgi:hypothetical protein